MAPFRVLKHIKHPGDVTVTPQGVAAKVRVQDAAVKNSNIATQLLSLLLVHFKSGSNYALLKVYQEGFQHQQPHFKVNLQS